MGEIEKCVRCACVLEYDRELFDYKNGRTILHGNIEFSLCDKCYDECWNKFIEAALAKVKD